MALPKFQSVEDYIDYLDTAWMRAKLHEVRMLILTYPEIRETVRYNAPFYDCAGKMMLYMGPYKKKRLMLGFCNGNLMKDPAGVLKNDAGQTQIRHYEFWEDEPVNAILLLQYIEEAILVNQQLSEPQHVTTRKSRKPSKR